MKGRDAVTGCRLLTSHTQIPGRCAYHSHASTHATAHPQLRMQLLAKHTRAAIDQIHTTHTFSCAWSCCPSCGPRALLLRRCSARRPAYRSSTPTHRWVWCARCFQGVRLSSSCEAGCTGCLLHTSKPHTNKHSTHKHTADTSTQHTNNTCMFTHPLSPVASSGW